MQHEPLIRLGCFLGVLLALAVGEAFAPRRRLSASKGARWFSNLGLAALNIGVLRVGFAWGAVGVAWQVERLGWGLLHQVALPGWIELVVAVLALDLAIYLQHVLFHAVPALWQLHLVHHADPDLDVTTGVRFHTLEIVLSMAIKVAAIVVLGPSALAVLAFEVLLNATSMFSHSNLAIPTRLDRWLRWIVVTPDMHRVHHSTDHRETNSNYGFNLPWWDYLLGTYRAQPAAGHETMPLGLSHVDPRRSVWLGWMLVLPFLRSNKNSERDNGERDKDERETTVNAR